MLSVIIGLIIGFIENGWADCAEADWKAFWKGLFKLAKDRAIDPYIVDWCVQIRRSIEFVLLCFLAAVRVFEGRPVVW